MDWVTGEITLPREKELPDALKHYQWKPLQQNVQFAEHGMCLYLRIGLGLENVTRPVNPSSSVADLAGNSEEIIAVIPKENDAIFQLYVRIHVRILDEERKATLNSLPKPRPTNVVHIITSKYLYFKMDILATDPNAQRTQSSNTVTFARAVGCAISTDPILYASIWCYRQTQGSGPTSPPRVSPRVPVRENPLASRRKSKGTPQQAARAPVSEEGRYDETRLWSSAASTSTPLRQPVSSGGTVERKTKLEHAKEEEKITATRKRALGPEIYLHDDEFAARDKHLGFSTTRTLPGYKNLDFGGRPIAVDDSYISVEEHVVFSKAYEAAIASASQFNEHLQSERQLVRDAVETEEEERSDSKNDQSFSYYEDDFVDSD